MMRLRTFVVTSSVMVVCLAIFVSWVQMKRLLDEGALTLERKELEHLSRMARVAIETKQAELRTYTRMLRGNNDLSSAYLIAKESGDIGLVDARLKKIRDDVSFDFAEIYSPAGKPIHKAGPALDPPTVARIVREKEGLLAATLGGKPALVSFATLKLYEEPIAILVIGTYPNEVVSLPGAETSFALSGKPVDDPAHGLATFVMGGLWVSIDLDDNPTAPFWHVFSYRLVMSALVSLLLLLVLLYCFFEIGFMRSFRQFVREVEAMVADVDRGDPRELPDATTWILENGLLYRATQKLVRSLIAHQKRMRLQVLLQEGLEKQRAIGEMASQVAHDIRSPLSALLMTTGALRDKLPEEHRVLMREAISRIQDIANDLIAKRREIEKPAREASVQLLSNLVESIVSEKRMQNRKHVDLTIGAKIDGESYGLFAHVPSSAFKTVLSNLLDNAVEAVDGKGNVTVSLAERHGWIAVTVEDDGRGIPHEILPSLAQRGFSFRKQGGSGLGLYHARTHAEAWGGALDIDSHLGEGTHVTLTLPKAEPPRWFVSGLAVADDTTVVVVDDDASIHQIWRKRFASVGSRVDLVHFSTPQQILEWSPEPGREVLYLVDYEYIGKCETGITIIDRLGIGPRAILVTSRFEEDKVVSYCESKYVRLLPKGMAGFVPIRQSPAS